MNTLRLAVFAALTSATIFGQTPLEFEVASIKPSAPSPMAALGTGLHINGSQVHASQLSLKDYMGIAYKLKSYQIAGPEWIPSARYDIAAKLPEGGTSEMVPAMLQKLFTDRFQMKMHRETRDFPVYALVVGKGGLKVTELPPDPDDDATPKGSFDMSVNAGKGGAAINLGRGSSFSVADNKFVATKMTMVMVADMMSRFVDRPIVDMTGLKGKYDFALEFTPEDFRAMMIRAAIASGVTLPPEALRMLEGVQDDSLFNAVQKVGLKLEARKAPLEMLVIDSAVKTPTEN